MNFDHLFLLVLQCSLSFAAKIRGGGVTVLLLLGKKRRRGTVVVI
jgi:hypothetical protein